MHHPTVQVEVSGSNSVFGWDSLLLWGLAVWWCGHGLLCRRTHRRRWEAVRWRGPHGGAIVRVTTRRKRRSTGWETRGKHHTWGWRGPHCEKSRKHRVKFIPVKPGDTVWWFVLWRELRLTRPHGRAPWPPGRVEVRRRGSVGCSSREGTIIGAHGAYVGWASHPWICFGGSPSITLVIEVKKWTMLCLQGFFSEQTRKVSF